MKKAKEKSRIPDSEPRIHTTVAGVDDAIKYLEGAIKRLRVWRLEVEKQELERKDLRRGALGEGQI